MINLDIRINIKKLSDYNKSLRESTNEETLLSLIENFSHYVLNLYGSMIEESINSRRYRGEWEPRDEEGYKEYLGVVPKNDILYLIKDSLEVKKIGHNFWVRFNPRYKYPETNIPLVQVLRAIETGTSDFSGRPILVKISRLLNSHIFDLWRGYLTMKGV